MNMEVHNLFLSVTLDNDDNVKDHKSCGHFRFFSWYAKLRHVTLRIFSLELTVHAHVLKY